MAESPTTTANTDPSNERAVTPVEDYLILLKPRVMSLVVFTGLAGMLAAPTTLPPMLMAMALICIALGAGAAGALNMWYERDIDALMTRTANRPLPQKRMAPEEALHFAVFLAVFAVLNMGLMLNWLAAGMLAVSILFYAIVYTIWLKPNTPQNIVIGGAAGALPPVIGWLAMTTANTSTGLNVTVDLAPLTDPLPWLMFLVIFMWTPAHFWALALVKEKDYRAANLPMLPVVKGRTPTLNQILLYTILTVAVSALPVVIGAFEWVYGITAAVLGGLFVAKAIHLRLRATDKVALQLFGFSIFYLFGLFTAMMVEGSI